MVRTTEDLGSVVGRDRERSLLLRTLDEAGPAAVFVHGPAGIGKSALLRAFLAEARDRGARVVRLDARSFEPTDQGFLAALSDALGVAIGDIPAAAAALDRLEGVVVLSVDTYEVFRISDTWLRSELAPELPERVRLVMAGREPPLSAWFDARGAPARFSSVLLGPLEDADAVGILRASGVPESEATAVNRVARGHPLALQVAAAAWLERPGLAVDEAAIPRLVEELTRLFLDQLDATTRSILDAAAVVRRTTAPLLGAMLPKVSVDEGLGRLASLPFVEEAPDGLRLHESVQQAIAARLRALDPETHRRRRAAAWRVLRRDLDHATRTELWRYTADMLYLLENPAVREAFFPTTAHLYAVEPARDDDAAAIKEIVGLHEPPEAAAVLAAWWESCPESFRVVRDRAGTTVGFMIVAEADAVPSRVIQADPVVQAWREHLARHPLPSGQRALFDRCELSRDAGGAPSPVQASTWLDIKRMYMELRPRLGRLYTVSADPAPYAEALTTLGFTLSPALVRLGRDYTIAWLDFGPESVDGWLARLAATEIGVQRQELLDEPNRRLVLDDGAVPLTPLEFGVLRRLLRSTGTAVSRAALLEDVWGHRYTGGSNVVDVVVRSLRRKLGAKSAMLETVRGVGYRFVEPGAA